MKSMYGIVYDFLKTNGKKSFEKIYEHLKATSLEAWKARFTNFDETAIDEIKIGELYTLLSINGDFSRKNDDLWTLTEDLTYDELKQSKIKVVENGE